MDLYDRVASFFSDRFFEFGDFFLGPHGCRSNWNLKPNTKVTKMSIKIPELFRNAS